MIRKFVVYKSKNLSLDTLEMAQVQGLISFLNQMNRVCFLMKNGTKYLPMKSPIKNLTSKEYLIVCLVI